jgi:hypothetical protein
MKSNRNIIKNENANASVNVIILAIFTAIMGFSLLTIGGYLYFSIASVADSGTKIVTMGHQATGSITFSGNTSNGKLFNITNGENIYIFEFNTSTASPSVCSTPNCIIVNVYNTNTSVKSSTNLTAAINANATVYALVHATDTTNVTTLTYPTRGIAGNSIVLSTNSLNAISSGLSGGVDDVTGQAAQNNINNYVIVTLPLMGLALMTLAFGVIFITLKKSFSNTGR